MAETRNKVFLCFDVIDIVIPLRIYYQNIEQTTEEQIPSIVLDQERRLCSQARTQQVPFFVFCLLSKSIHLVPRNTLATRCALVQDQLSSQMLHVQLRCSTVLCNILLEKKNEQQLYWTINSFRISGILHFYYLRYWYVTCNHL
jgi:hypothetical protein